MPNREEGLPNFANLIAERRVCQEDGEHRTENPVSRLIRWCPLLSCGRIRITACFILTTSEGWTRSETYGICAVISKTFRPALHPSGLTLINRGQNDIPRLFTSDHSTMCRIGDNGAMRTKGFFGNRLPPHTVLNGVQQVEMFLKLIRERNALVLTGKREESDELHRGKKPLREGETRQPQ
jgi:hypothetical protein